MQPYLRFIGDVHGQYNKYCRAASGASHSIQVGDLGFEYDILDYLDPQCHKVLAGNHDNYRAQVTKHWLGDYGVHRVYDHHPIYYIRGGYSIDWKYRVPGHSWWAEEELSHRELVEAIEHYRDNPAPIVVSHECPAEIVKLAFGVKLWDGEQIRPSRTALALQRMWEIRQPQLWVFGHHHTAWNQTINGTSFHCIPELGTVDLDHNAQIIPPCS